MKDTCISHSIILKLEKVLVTKIQFYVKKL